MYPTAASCQMATSDDLTFATNDVSFFEDGVSDDSLVAEATGLFSAVVRIALANIFLNAFRHDPFVSWTMRLPRIVWELSIASVARSARARPPTRKRYRATMKKKNETQASAMKCAVIVTRKDTVELSAANNKLLSLSPSRFMLLAFMLITTALSDIFIWAPIFAAMINFRTCTGGWLTGESYNCKKDLKKGIGRMVVVIQCLLGGIVYLTSGLSAWNLYIVQRDRQSVARHVQAQQFYLEHQHRVEEQRRRLLQEERLRHESHNLQKSPDTASQFWSMPLFWPSE